MDLNDNYIITSDEGTGSNFPANFYSSIRVQEGHKLALKSIFYGPVFNVTTNRCLLVVSHLDAKKNEFKKKELFLEPGFYSNILALTFEIVKTINTWIDNSNVFCVELNAKLKHCEVNFDAETGTIILTMSEHLFLEQVNTPNVLDLLELGSGIDNRWAGYEVKNGYFANSYPALIYSSVVENSYVNNHATRLLAIVPMQSGFIDGDQSGHHFYEFMNPTYYNFAIKEFSQIYFQIRDMNGELLEFDKNYRTVLSLEVFKPIQMM